MRQPNGSHLLTLLPRYIDLVLLHPAITLRAANEHVEKALGIIVRCAARPWPHMQNPALHATQAQCIPTWLHR